MVAVDKAHNQFMAKFAESRQFVKENEKDEILLKENKHRFVMFPIKYHEIWAAYKKVEADFWTAEEIEYSKDVEDIESKLNDGQKDFLARYLSTMTLSEEVLNHHLIEKFSAELQNPEGKSFYGYQIMMENIYDEIYAMMVDAYFNGSDEPVKYFKVAKTMPELKLKLDFVDRWIKNSDSLYGERLVAFAAKEGIFLAGAHAAIFAQTKSGLLPGLAKATTNIFRDTGNYTDFSCLLFAHLNNKPDAKIIEKIITEAVDIEKKYLVDALKIEEFGVDVAQINQYVEFLADALLGSFGNDKIYNVANPFEYLEGATTVGKSNFFEKQVSDFTKANENTQKAAAHEAFSFNDSF
ncbi:similar to Saccharomyces cerevisiae YJL026W RNR2 Ribonucleotide- diphosphate reductase (RNR), small subunit [Maudiozyma barnettii]|uniref:Similar to Saccharomyces cerevisiae YJL026W RNR2 Ribonucleotide- diphosphate reductase (RNR), small subunit n=1 Tax=Maudiozyma barnettii TaxID=61262 RepID=A0A8H2VHH4_9SACH|nr:uncharacterized protein KABA2_07S03872 [Kazachstania barnettii]CAB4255761.1 similar to Saccharomyces cerevisiae YJL026W RNR2 Ribonucleotide- diphosphate reductase (RNR), small subunit [Kazachstania barnettii]CAD1784322.1 similar to Saccharomyces cerevisiae YJL026W RNR2 Ribonucleotide- diphosphate reductase (RNR), small subunit [Kazachstania barnettii]